MTTRRIGPTPIPTDANVEDWLHERIDENDQELYIILKSLQRTIDQTRQSGEPVVFAYGKLLNYIATDPEMTEPVRIKMLAAALWELSTHDN